MKSYKKIIVPAFLFLSVFTALAFNETDTTSTFLLVDPIEKPLEKNEKNTVQIALLLDTSNSMDGLINQAKSQLWDIVNEFSLAKCDGIGRPQLQIALYQYGNDDLSAREGYIQQVLDFSSDLDEISEKLFSLTTNGGEEYCGTVIHTSLKQLPWNTNSDQLKMIFIAGNEPFDQGKLNYKGALADAKEKDIIINTIFCGDFQQGVSSYWKEGATLTGGEYMAIDHNQDFVQISSPYDDAILRLNKKLNKTYISYGNLGQSKRIAQETQDANAMELEEVVAVKRAVSKSSRLYNNKKWDLVDASEDADFEIASVPKENLPTELQGKSEKEIQRFIGVKKLEREEIQKEIQQLNTKREAFINKNQHNKAEVSLENVMLRAIKKQAQSKNYSWE